MRSTLDAQANGDFAGALVELKAALKVAITARDRRSIVLFATDIGALCDRMGRLAEAAEFYQFALAAEPDDSWAYLLLGDVYEQMGARKQAERVLSACRRVAKRTNNREVLDLLRKRGKAKRA